MSPVIRLSDLIFKRLESQAIGFDTPSNVIERLLDFYELNKHSSKNSHLESINHGCNPTSSKIKYPHNKKDRNLETEKSLKNAVGYNLNWGKFTLNNSILNFTDSQKEVLCKYSSSFQGQDKWFWGVSDKYWLVQNENLYLALIIENTEGNLYSFLLLEPKETFHLYSQCSESSGEKKINLILYKSDNKLHLQEWKEYDVENNIRSLKI